MVIGFRLDGWLFSGSGWRKRSRRLILRMDNLSSGIKKGDGVSVRPDYGISVGILSLESSDVKIEMNGDILKMERRY